MIGRDEDRDDYPDMDDRMDFADPGGNSALRAANKWNPPIAATTGATRTAVRA